MSAVFIVEPEPRRAPPAEQFADFLRRLRLTVQVRRVAFPDLSTMPYVASLPDGWRVSANHYDYGEAAADRGQTPLHAVQRLAERLAGRVLRKGNVGGIKVPPLLVPSHMGAADWVTRDGPA